MLLHAPDLEPRRVSPRPDQLARLIMRRAAWVAVPVLVAALTLGALRMADDVAEEVDAAAGLAQAMAELGRLSARGGPGDDAGAATLDALLLLQQSQPLRHLQLQVQDAQGHLLLPPAPTAPQDGLGAWLQAWLPAGQEPQQVAWQLPRPGGRDWTVRLTTSPEAERREALASLLESLVLLALAVLGLVLVMRWNLRRALAPLNRLVASITDIEAQDHRSVQALPTMPVQELETLAAALRHLGVALEAAESGRNTLRQQVLTLQEDERARLARELHDEFGQRLTAMRVDATWLGKRLAMLQAPAEDTAQPGPRAELAGLQTVVVGLAEQCAQIQQDIRGLLLRLQPFGPDAGGDGHGLAPARLADLLQGLVQSWGAIGRSTGLACTLSLQWQPVAGAPCQAWPDGTDGPGLPQPLALTLYRITQEALTNVARHAGAQQAQVHLLLQGPAVAGGPLQLVWSVADDGQGLGAHPAAPAARGSGLAGLRERVWSQGSELQVGPAQPAQAERPGLRLAAEFHARWLPGLAEQAEGPPPGHPERR